MRQEIHATAEKSQKTMRRVGDELSVQNDGLAKIVQDGNDKTWQTMAAESEKAEAERAAAAAGREKANAAHDEMIRRLQAERDAREEAELAEMKARAEARARQEAKEIAEMEKRVEARKLEQEEAKREERQWAQMQEARSILTRSSTSPAVHAAPAAPAALLR